MLNGIHSFIDQPDLAQRCLTLQLRHFDPQCRQTDAQLKANFERDLPAIFRGCLDLISKILGTLPSAQPLQQERMLDFVHWLTAMEPHVPVQPGDLQKAYNANLINAMRASLEDNPLAIAVLDFAKLHQQQPWSGTSSDLLRQLNAMADAGIRNTPAWPQNEISLSLRLKSLEAPLSGAGVNVAPGVRGIHRSISITYTGRSS